MDASDPEPRRIPSMGWVTVGAAIGAVVCCLRYLSRRAALDRLVGDATPAEEAIHRWDAAHDLIGAQALCVAAGLAVGFVTLRVARAAHPWARPFLGAASALGLVAATAPWGGPPRGRAELRWDLAWDDLGFQALCAVALVALAAWVARAWRGTGERAGASSTAVGLAAVLLVPFLLGRSLASDTPTFVRRMALLDLLARTDLWKVTERHPDVAPQVAVITPAVHQHADAADKPALWMPPPCTVEVTLPVDAAPGVLRAAAGVDKQVRGRMPQGIAQVAIEFEVARNGKSVFRATVVSERPRPGTWSSPEWVWRHVGGAAGVPVGPGDRLTFRTRIPAGDPGEHVPAELLRAGFGGMVIEAGVETRRTRASAGAPNLVLVVMDTLRADRMSCYGYGRPTTPNLDRLAASGVLFERAYAASSWTWPSTASILTGLAADAHGVTRNESCTLNLALTSLPEVLQARGYTTAAFSGNPLVAPERYFDQGFEHFDHSAPDFRMSDELVPAALRWLDGHAGARFFLYLHLVDPHTPHRPHPDELARLGAVARPPDFPAGGFEAFSAERLREAERTGSLPAVDGEDAAWVRDVYDASVATGDRWVGIVLQHLADLGVAGDTIVVFTSDHGEELFDRDRIGHGHGVHGELVRAPLILAGPGIPRGARVGTVVSNRHVAPTIAHFAGAELFGMGDGVLLIDGVEASDGAVFQTAKGHWRGRNYQELFGLRDGDLVLHWWRENGGEGEVRLYDAEADPDERRDLADERPAEARAMLEELRARLERQRAWAPEHVVGVGAGGLETLYHIGYADREEE